LSNWRLLGHWKMLGVVVRNSMANEFKMALGLLLLSRGVAKERRRSLPESSFIISCCINPHITLPAPIWDLIGLVVGILCILLTRDISNLNFILDIVEVLFEGCEQSGRSLFFSNHHIQVLISLPRRGEVVDLLFKAL
jgi:hypothetical protein